MNVVFMIDIQNDDRSKNTPYKLSQEVWKAWIEDKPDTELFVLNEPLFDDPNIRPNFYKMYFPQLMEATGQEWDKCLYVDSDTIPSPDLPNIFDVVGDKFGVVRNFGSCEWVVRSILNWRNNLFPEEPILNYSRYFNSGMMVFSKHHTEFFEKAQECFTENFAKIMGLVRLGCGIDQTMLNFLTRKHNVDMMWLPYEYNMQDLIRFEVPDDWPGYIWHFNAISNDPQNHHTNILMQTKANYLWR